jgi:hypothetical protein
MSNTTYLDLDALTPNVKRVVKVFGAEHVLLEPSMSTFLAETKRAAEFDAKWGDSPPAEAIAETVLDFVATCFPTISRNDLLSLPVRQLAAIREFVTADISPTAEAEELGNALRRKTPKRKSSI